jgi:hypothetical protein
MAAVTGWVDQGCSCQPGVQAAACPAAVTDVVAVFVMIAEFVSILVAGGSSNGG